MLLDVQNLCASYGSIAALDTVSFTVEKGHIVAIVGANGAGKSTVLRAISGLHRPSAGAILYKGEDISGRPAHVIARMGIAHVPEGRGIFAPLTVMENLEVAASAGQPKTAFEKALAHVFDLFPRLRERAKQPAGTLSGGEQQMLAVGRALVSGAGLLLLDEPSMGLSPSLVSSMFETIVRINREGATILLVEQNAHKALAVAHEAYVLETGSIVMAGEAARIRDDPRVIAAYLGG